MLIFYVEVASVYCGCKSVMNHLPPGIVFSFALFTKSAYLMHISKVKFLFVVYGYSGNCLLSNRVFIM